MYAGLLAGMGLLVIYLLLRYVDLFSGGRTRLDSSEAKAMTLAASVFLFFILLIIELDVGFSMIVAGLLGMLLHAGAASIL